LPAFQTSLIAHSYETAAAGVVMAFTYGATELRSSSMHGRGANSVEAFSQLVVVSDAICTHKYFVNITGIYQ